MTALLMFASYLWNEKRVFPEPEVVAVAEDGEVMSSTVFSLKDGYGFISYPQTNNLFFHFSFLVDTDFNDLREGDNVEFTLSENDQENQLPEMLDW